ncbi:glycosyltransferase [Collinsella aerofaciens]|uniref:glycosyltransferase n=1 Tax=Collinsella aerofaciens TaxID=74426 RepID=UPI0018ABC38F|nr:glycosyltransferase family 2 protein [Collinsella aerofaciens]
MDISVIIPTLNAEHDIEGLLTVLGRQSIQPIEILVVDSASEDRTIELIQKHKGVRLLQIDRQDFNHGSTRDLALRESRGDFVCFLTQDAVPVSDDYLELLVAPMVDDSEIALVSGRQLPKADARRFEQLVRGFNYPDSSSVRSKRDLKQFGIKTFFASDTCSAYRRTAYLECGGFEHVNTNEDMLMAARFITSGMKVAYEPRAEVYHSHNFTPSQQFARNRAVGFFLESHADDLMHTSETGEGGRLVKSVSLQLLREGNFGEFVAFGVDCCARLLGNRAGRRAARKERL